MTELGATSAIKAIVGKDGWLFLSNDTNQAWDQFRGALLLNQKELTNWQEELAQRGAFMRKHNTHYRFIVAPNKECIVPELVPDGFQKAPARLVHQVEAAAKGQVHGLFLERFLLGHAERRAFFAKGDTHWSDRCAWHVANHIFKGLDIPRKIPLISQDEVTFHTSETRLGDLSNKFDPPIGLGGERVVLGKSRAKVSFDNRISNHGHVRIWEGGDPDGPTVLLLGDSFAGALEQFVAYRARRLVRLHASAIDREVFYRERPQVVLSVTVERFLRSPPVGLTAFSYKSNLRQKVQALDEPALRKIRTEMLQQQSALNAAYAADLLSVLSLE